MKNKKRWTADNSYPRYGRQQEARVHGGVSCGWLHCSSTNQTSPCGFTASGGDCSLLGFGGNGPWVVTARCNPPLPGASRSQSPEPSWLSQTPGNPSAPCRLWSVLGLGAPGPGRRVGHRLPEEKHLACVFACRTVWTQPAPTLPC